MRSKSLGETHLSTPGLIPLCGLKRDGCVIAVRDYYDDHGRSDDVVISVPKGSYLPVFSERQPAAGVERLDVLRLSVLPPENTAFDSFVIAPDRRRIAFAPYWNGRMTYGCGTSI